MGILRDTNENGGVEPAPSGSLAESPSSATAIFAPPIPAPVAASPASGSSISASSRPRHRSRQLQPLGAPTWNTGGTPSPHR